MADLLDLIVEATEKAKAAEAPPRPAARRPTDPQVEAMARKLDEDRIAEARRDWAEAERRAVEAATERPVEMCGFVVGSRFEVRNCGAEVNGRWVVARIDPGPAGDQSRSLWATRASGEAGAIRFGERKLLDAIHARLVVRED
jgi:hypothetical protein